MRQWNGPKPKRPVAKCGMDWGWDVICVGRGLSESGFAGFFGIFRIVSGEGGRIGLATEGQFKVHGVACPLGGFPLWIGWTLYSLLVV